jgi:hypothetical protein
MDPFIIKSNLKHNKINDGYDSDCSGPCQLSPYDINNGRITFRHIEAGAGGTYTPRKRTY